MQREKVDKPNLTMKALRCCSFNSFSNLYISASSGMLKSTLTSFISSSFFWMFLNSVKVPLVLVPCGSGNSSIEENA